MPMLTDVGARLLAAGIPGVTALTIDLFENNEPEGQIAQDKVLTLRETVGEQTEMQFGSAVAQTEFPRLQAFARGAKGGEDEARLRLQAVINNLVGVQATVLGTTLYQMIHCFNGPTWLGTDASERPRYAANFRIEKDAD